ncbi:cytochrome c, class I [Halomonas sp. MCCC 1A17488]|uniref:Cytochrome c, class I n=1 Tax=Billgrantia sulfidoxydans TaxID=2733484 RepID=A0ABX7W733_9GAMM|nr:MULTISPECIES: c-type cytochrome [Halomonas]MCE8017523.1 cytochrome c, class I [Halomonas sp. MCCC 1A17488]MCG3240856.1 cytochrome c, class I [Halomonas sp. MCCC 1A17488]QPP48732.1 cytochrome c, class I [Halomonas sp. SS10-MC5]QTP56071.1 cytochrome c, class I [Halomonas sulfidoxydans]
MKRTLHEAIAMLLGVLPLLGSAIPSLAEDTFSTEQMALMAGACANCHGTDGRLAGSVPTIAGRPAAVLEARLLAFKRDEASDATVMNRIAKGFSDEELAALAGHFSAIDPQADEAWETEQGAQE